MSTNETILCFGDVIEATRVGSDERVTGIVLNSRNGTVIVTGEGRTVSVDAASAVAVEGSVEDSADLCCDAIDAMAHVFADANLASVFVKRGNGAVYLHDEWSKARHAAYSHQFEDGRFRSQQVFGEMLRKVAAAS